MQASAQSNNLLFGCLVMMNQFLLNSPDRCRLTISNVYNAGNLLMNISTCIALRQQQAGAIETISLG
jgi:hypothetical protein